MWIGSSNVSTTTKEQVHALVEPNYIFIASLISPYFYLVSTYYHDGVLQIFYMDPWLYSHASSIFLCINILVFFFSLSLSNQRNLFQKLFYDVQEFSFPKRLSSDNREKQENSRFLRRLISCRKKGEMLFDSVHRTTSIIPYYKKNCWIQFFTVSFHN